MFERLKGEGKRADRPTRQSVATEERERGAYARDRDGDAVDDREREMPRARDVRARQRALGVT